VTGGTLVAPVAGRKPDKHVDVMKLTGRTRVQFPPPPFFTAPSEPCQPVEGFQDRGPPGLRHRFAGVVSFHSQTGRRFTTNHAFLLPVTVHAVTVDALTAL